MKSLSLLLVSAVVFLLTAVLQAYDSTTVFVQQDDDLAKVFAERNRQYIIKSDINLGGKTIRIGEGCLLVFRGGSLSNGTVIGNNTRIKSKNYEIFKRGYTRFRAYKIKDSNDKMPPSLEKRYHNSIVIEGTWSNKSCGSNWTGLLKESDEDVMLALKNFVSLFEDGSKIKLPTVNAYGYENTRLPGNHVIDFHNSIISYPDDLSIWEDDKIPIPDNAVSCSMETGYGFLFIRNKTIISNLTLDGKSYKRHNEPLRLGVSCLICIDNAQGIQLENVTLSNALGPAVVVHANSRDITFKNCRFFEIGEHIVYSHQRLGYCHFEGCIFDTWDSERLSVYRNGFNYVYKHNPLSSANDTDFEGLYDFDLSFTNCTFINPERVTNQGRTLGGFLTGNYPVIIKLNGCKFLGAPVMLNPGGKDYISEKSGKAFKMIVRRCDGTPYAYASKANYNIITEFFDCTNIPFRVNYAKRYENCTMFIDTYEDNLENVSHTFEKEFSEPLIIKKCILNDRGNKTRVYHPLAHRPIVFEECQFSGATKREEIQDLVSVAADSSLSIEFISCTIDLPNYRLVGGKKRVNNVKHCRIKAIHD